MRQYKIKIGNKTTEWHGDKAYAIRRAKVLVAEGHKAWVTDWKNNVIWRDSGRIKEE